MCQINIAIQNIGELIGRVISQSQSISAVVDESLQSSQEIATTAEQIDRVSHEVVDQASQMRDTISSAAVRGFLNTVKLDHVVWKNDLYQRIASSDLRKPVMPRCMNRVTRHGLQPSVMTAPH